MASPDLLRFITAGSVDDGKSTFIGRLLYDSRGILDDQAEALKKARNKRAATGGEIDFSLLTDGLEAEREQGITIDVAYRYFRSPVRRFIIADTPGHEQYTRNMFTGASTADAAVLLIDASRVENRDGRWRLLDQTRRHSAIIKLLGIRSVIAAVNKMDLFDFDRERFEAQGRAYRELAEQLGLKNTCCVPISALKGDNVVRRSERTPWYTGGSVLEILESLPQTAEHDARSASLRFPVQYVVRQNGDSFDAFRGLAGQIESGTLEEGQTVRIVPGDMVTRIAEVHAPGGRVTGLGRGSPAIIRLERDADVSRGDMIVDATSDVFIARRLNADLCWFDGEPLNPQRKYLLHLGTAVVFARIAGVRSVLNVQTLSSLTNKSLLEQNDIGEVDITLQKPIACDRFSDKPETGSFTLIDPVTNRTLAAGMVKTLPESHQPYVGGAPKHRHEN
ncbi:MAG: sulfate adenylyltransferase [Methylobacteriaceae bacterium]|jgi:sulfate adenylyltransferase subunit 1|nr:sulfate adenylyltransferase [Methylobacteriaceae bacterium]